MTLKVAFESAVAPKETSEKGRTVLSKVTQQGTKALMKPIRIG